MSDQNKLPTQTIFNRAVYTLLDENAKSYFIGSLLKQGLTETEIKEHLDIDTETLNHLYLLKPWHSPLG